MSPSHRGACYVVVDDFLDRKTLQSLRSYAIGLNYQTIDSVVDHRIDGRAFRSAGGIVSREGRFSRAGPETALRMVMGAVMEHPEIFGSGSDAWNTMSYAFWKYPSGSRLGWHNDAGRGRTGEYILYLHDEWRCSWGGELIILDKRDAVDFTGVTSERRITAVEEAVSQCGDAFVAIQPKPNRLVLVSAGTCHYINRVDAAGQRERTSLTGFTSLVPGSNTSADRLKRLDKFLDPVIAAESGGN